MPEHAAYRDYVERLLAGPGPYATTDLVLSSLLRIVTNPRVFTPPSPLEAALDFVTELRDRPNRVDVRPGSRHWGIFTALCRDTGARGNLVPDAYLAALAIESGTELVTADRDFALFPRLRRRHPLED